MSSHTRDSTTPSTAECTFGSHHLLGLTAVVAVSIAATSWVWTSEFRAQPHIPVPSSVSPSSVLYLAAMAITTFVYTLHVGFHSLVRRPARTLCLPFVLVSSLSAVVTIFQGGEAPFSRAVLVQLAAFCSTALEFAIRSEGLASVSIAAVMLVSVYTAWLAVLVVASV